MIGIQERRKINLSGPKTSLVVAAKSDTDLRISGSVKSANKNRPSRTGSEFQVQSRFVVCRMCQLPDVRAAGDQKSVERDQELDDGMRRSQLSPYREGIHSSFRNPRSCDGQSMGT